MHRPRSPYRALLQPLTKALEESGQLSEATLAFVETSLFPARPERLVSFLTDADSESERDSLLDLIFSPDLAVQLTLEPLIEGARWSAEDSTALSHQLMATPLRAWIRMPDGTRLVRIPVPDFIKSQYLDRLNIRWHLNEKLRAAIEQHLALDMAVCVKVRLRNGKLRPTVDQEVMLCRFFERMAGDDPDFLACLDLFLSLVDRTVKADCAYDHLVAHKRFLFRSLQQARRFEVLLRRSNMETLMLQGLRVPHAPQEELMAHMRLIDLICTRMFGKTEAIAPPMEAPMRVVTDLESPDAAVRSLMDT